jgi:hypothetical protein
MSKFRFDQDGRDVSEQDIIRDFLELEEPLKFAVALIIHRSKQLHDANWPLSSHDGGGRSGKPSSRAPGREQCSGEIEWLMKRLPDTAHAIDNRWARVASRERREHRIETMGGITIAAPNGVAVTRRETRITTHLHGKLVEAYKVGGTD